MLDRIPHGTQAIQGELATEKYLKDHGKYFHLQYKPFMQELARQIKNGRLPPNGRFLEIGSGPGLLTAAIAEQYPWVEMNALELSTDMIAMAKKIVGRMQPACRIRFIEGNVEDHSQMIHLGKFDLVYSTFSLHHWDKPIQAIKSIYRSIKTGGMMLLFDLKRVPWLYVLPARNGFIESIRAAYRSSEIRKILSRAHINHYRIRTPFPYFWHSILIEK